LRGRALRTLLADTRPLRESPEYRRLWLGQTLSATGGQMTTFAVALQVFVLTGSSAAVGGVGLSFAVPAIVIGLVSGALIDSVDRRQLVLITSSLQAGVSVAFAVQAFSGSRAVWLLYLLTAVQGGVGAVNAPARRTFVPRLLPRDQVPAGAALSVVTMHLSAIAGPALAGVITAAGGLKICYLLDAISFAGALYAVFRLPAMRPEPGTGAGRGLARVREGFRFIADSKVLIGALLSDVSATMLAMPVALFPAINAERFGGSPRTLGLLSAGLAIGGVAGTVFSGPLRHVHRQGLGVLVAGAVWGAALTGFGAVHGLALTLAFLIVAGVADVCSVMMRSTIVQLATPDAYRARINAAELTVGAGVPQLGNFRAGLVAEGVGPGASAGIGGIAAVIGAVLVGIAFPALVRYSTRDDVRDSDLSAAQPVHQ
jgi:MFS family permease